MNLTSGDPTRENSSETRESFPSSFSLVWALAGDWRFESTSANCWLPDFVYDDACLRLGVWFLN